MTPHFISHHSYQLATVHLVDLLVICWCSCTRYHSRAMGVVFWYLCYVCPAAWPPTLAPPGIPLHASLEDADMAHADLQPVMPHTV